jgi:type II secretory pathway pseudopilin PulG
MYLGKLKYRWTRHSSSSQSGYMLIVLVFIMTGLILAALAMAPAITQQIKRDREKEMIHRGVQYARAVQKYYKKFGRYPPSIEALEDTNHIRFLRKRYKDPMTPDGKWQIVRFGQVQVNAASRPGGTGFSGGQPGLPNVPGVSGLLSGQNPTSPGATPGSATGSSSTSSTSTETVGGGSGSSFGQSMGGGNQLFGGGAIIGVASMSDKQSIRVIADKDHYKDWKFVYDPTFDRGGLITGPYDPKKAMGQYVNTAQPGQQIGQPIGQQPGSMFNNPGSSFGQPSQGPLQGPTLPPDQMAQPKNQP